MPMRVENGVLKIAKEGNGVHHCLRTAEQRDYNQCYNG